MVKNMKKRSISESEVAVKTTEKFVSKKKKSENGSVQNGQSNKEVKKNLPQKVKAEMKPGVGVVVKKEVNEAAADKTKKQTSNKVENEEKMQKRQAFREKRKLLRQENKHGLRPDLSIEDIKRKIELIEKRGNITKSAKRKLAQLRKLYKVKEGTYEPKQQVSKKQAEKGKNEKSVEATKKKQVQVNAEKKKKVPEKVDAKAVKDNKKKDAKQGSLLLVKQKESEDEDEDEDEDDEDEENVELEDDASEDEDGSDVVEEEDEDDEEDDEDDEEEAEEEEEEEDDDENDEEDEEEDEEEEVKTSIAPTPQVKEKAKQNVESKQNTEPKQNTEQDGKKKRFVLFVGNLPYTATEEEIKKHFLTKVSEIVDIRIPKNDNNTSRGFAYVELANNVDYEKGLSLNHSFVNGRRIKVQYSGSNRKETVAKNQKLQALQRAGKLAGGPRKFNQKFSGKRGKPYMQKTKT